MDTFMSVVIAVVIMGAFLFGSVYIGLHYSKKSAKRLKEQREKENYSEAK